MTIIDSQNPGYPSAFSSDLKPFQDDAPTWENPIPRVRPRLERFSVGPFWAVAKKNMQNVAINGGLMVV